MRKTIISALAAMAMISTLPGTATTGPSADYNVIPLPDTVRMDSAPGFRFNADTKIAVLDNSHDMTRNAELLAGYLGQLTGIAPEITNRVSGNVILLSDNLLSDNKDAYRISVGPERIIIDGASPAGTFYGIQTLRKSAAAAGNAENGLTFPAATVAASPRFRYRGAMFDTARHFFPADSLKEIIDVMAMHNINRFHWHITDDQGWRVPVDRYPRLISKGSVRKNTVIGPNTDRYDDTPYGGHYTKQEIRDIVKYASDRHITIIPEIDMPGHMTAALASYPELGCTGGPYEVWNKWGINDEVLCAGNDSVYAFVNNVLDEITELFPGEYMHIGGDECPKTKWESCPKCQARIRQLGLKTDEHGTAEQKLQSYFMTRAAEHLAAKGKKTIGWDEIMEGGLTPGAIVMSWQGIEGGRDAAGMGHDAIMAPSQYMYFDFVQTEDREGEPQAATWGDPTPLEKVYGYDPAPAGELTPEQARHILGVQANTWTEYIPTVKHAEYMLLPRLAALSEIQWRDPAAKDYNDFLRRLPGLAALYRACGYNYAGHALKE